MSVASAILEAVADRLEPVAAETLAALAEHLASANSTNPAYDAQIAFEAATVRASAKAAIDALFAAKRAAKARLDKSTPGA